jgi:hypothetical protein
LTHRLRRLWRLHLLWHWCCCICLALLACVIIVVVDVRVRGRLYSRRLLFHCRSRFGRRRHRLLGRLLRVNGGGHFYVGSSRSGLACIGLADSLRLLLGRLLLTL